MRISANHTDIADRVVEHVFERLITWAAAAIETSSNQPVLPHAVIVLNASEHDIDEKLWDVPANTQSILEGLARTVNRNETFKKWAQFWRERNKPINTLLDLVLCYYSSVQVRNVILVTMRLVVLTEPGIDPANPSTRPT